MRHGSLFSGIGGFDLAAEWMGWENVFHCEWMEFPRKVLDYHFPNADSHIDICKTDFKKYANTIDILTGGFPCQPFSLAGKRKGTDDERYLWGEMLRAIQEIKPKYVIAENVFGITNIDGGLVFEQVCLDLEAEGYEVQPFIIPACAKNAPHRRDRCWFIAYSSCNANGLRTKGGMGMDGQILERRKGEKKANGFNNNCENANVTNSDSGGLEGAKKVGWDGINVERESEFGATSDTIGIGLQRKGGSTKLEGGRFSFDNTQNNKTTWDNFPTQSPICGGDDGIPTELDGITFSKWRNESIKAYGNAIVPQVAYEIFKAIERTI
jgi:DNA (cytosine-5)-methyltransferase 1